MKTVAKEYVGMFWHVKTCSKCKKTKSTLEFYEHSNAPDKLRYSCKSCWREQDKKWEINNKEIRLKYRSEWAVFQRKTNFRRKINHVMSSAIYRSIKSKKAGKVWKDLTGYTTEDLIKHLESKFTPQMNWNNYGTYWSIDHIKPLSKFNEDEIEKSWMLENLQPLELMENIRKGARYEE